MLVLMLPVFVCWLEVTFRPDGRHPLVAAISGIIHGFFLILFWECRPWAEEPHPMRERQTFKGQKLKSQK